MSDFSFDKDKFGFKKEAFKTYSLTREQRENRRIRNLRKKNLPKGKITVFDQYSLGDILCVYRMFKDKFPKLSPIHFMMLFTLYELEHFTSITIESLLKTKRKTAYVIVSSLSKQGVIEIKRSSAGRSGYLTLYKLSYKARYMINQAYKSLYEGDHIAEKHLPKKINTPPVRK